MYCSKVVIVSYLNMTLSLKSGPLVNNLPCVRQFELLLQLGNLVLEFVLLLGILHRDRLGLAHFCLELTDLALQVA